MSARRRSRFLAVLAWFLAALPGLSAQDGLPAKGAARPAHVFDVRDFGAPKDRGANAQGAIQAAVDACAAAGGGMVYVPPGEYSSGTIHLRSHVRFFVEAGATIFAIKDRGAFDQEALFFGEDLVDITLAGRGTIDGQAGYEWRPNDHRDDFIMPNQVMMERLGKPLLRSFPRKDQFGKLVLLLRCRDVRISGLTFIDSPSWTIHPYGCERMVIDGCFISSSLAEAVWADGIDPDGCKDLRISNCTIATGDDAIVFYSMDWFGPALPCENITVTNCRLSSASSALKFCDGNMNCIRNVAVDNCVIRGSNRGVAFMVFDGGFVRDIVLSNLVIECVRHDWFWWGDGDPFHFNIKTRREVHQDFPLDKDHPPGAISNVKIQNVIARGKGSCMINGHPESWLDGISFENVKLFIAHDPAAAYDKAVHAFDVRWARDFRLRDFEVVWEEPGYGQWRSALRFQDVSGLVLDGFCGRGAQPEAPAVLFRGAKDILVRGCTAAAGTGAFLFFEGEEPSEAVRLIGNDAGRAGFLYAGSTPAAAAGIESAGNLGTLAPSVR